MLTKKIIVSFLIIAVITGSGVFIPPKTATAQDAGSIMKECGLDVALDWLAGAIGSLVGSIKKSLKEKAKEEAKKVLKGLLGDKGPVPTHDKDTEKTVEIEETKNTFQRCAQYIKEVVFRRFTENLKKQLLDRLVDDIVDWIEHGDFPRGQPRFVTDYGKTLFEDALDAAVGQTIRDVGLGNLCYPQRMLAGIEISIPRRPPTFTRRVSCTLSDVVANIQAFRDDFRQGGWIAFSRSMAPQNNLIGLRMMVLDQVLIQEELEREKTRTAVLAGAGFRGQQRCVSWSRSVRTSRGQLVEDVLNVNSGNSTRSNVAWSDNFYSQPPDPGTPPRSGYELLQSGEEGYNWLCKKVEETMPGRSVGDIAESAISADVQYIANTRDADKYKNAIFDALSRRLMKGGVGFLRRGTASLFSRSGQGLDPEPEDPTVVASREAERKATDPLHGYGLENVIATAIAESRASLNSARVNLNRAISLSNRLIELAEDFVACMSVACPSADLSGLVDSFRVQNNYLSGLAITLNGAEASLNALGNQLTADSPDLLNILGEVDDIQAQIGGINSFLIDTISELEIDVSEQEESLLSCRKFTGEIPYEEGEERPASVCPAAGVGIE